MLMDELDDNPSDDNDVNRCGSSCCEMTLVDM